MLVRNKESLAEYNDKLLNTLSLVLLNSNEYSNIELNEIDNVNFNSYQNFLNFSNKVKDELVNKIGSSISNYEYNLDTKTKYFKELMNMDLKSYSIDDLNSFKDNIEEFKNESLNWNENNYNLDDLIEILDNNFINDISGSELNEVKILKDNLNELSYLKIGEGGVDELFKSTHPNKESLIKTLSNNEKLLTNSFIFDEVNSLNITRLIKDKEKILNDLILNDEQKVKLDKEINLLKEISKSNFSLKDQLIKDDIHGFINFAEKSQEYLNAKYDLDSISNDNIEQNEYEQQDKVFNINSELLIAFSHHIDINGSIIFSIINNSNETNNKDLFNKLNEAIILNNNIIEDKNKNDFYNVDNLIKFRNLTDELFNEINYQYASVGMDYDKGIKHNELLSMIDIGTNYMRMDGFDIDVKDIDIIQDDNSYKFNLHD